MLDLWRLTILKELADLGTMTAVAGALRLTRPAVSQHLSQLEREVGVTLLERTPRGVRLTEAGVRLAVQSRELLAHVEAIEADVAHTKGRVAGPIRIAAFGSFASVVVPPVIQQLQADYPDLEPTFIELEPAKAVRSVLAQQVDVAVVDELTTVAAASGSLNYVSLMEDQFLAVLQETHPLAERSSIRLQDLARERWVMNESASTYHGFLTQACWNAGFSPNIVCSCRSASSAMGFVEIGWAITVLPGLVSSMLMDGLVCKPLEPNLVRKVSAAVARGSLQRPSISAVLAALRKESGRHPT